MLTLTTGLRDATPVALSTGPVEEAHRILALLPDTLAAIRSQALPSFWVSLLVGAALAAASWLGAVYFARLWNRRYRLRRWQHMLCAAAALITFAAAPIWAAVGYVQSTARAASQLCEERLATSDAWRQQTYAEAYETIERLDAEDLSDIPSPGQSGSHIPLTDSATVRAVGQVYTRRTTDYLNKEYPQLSAFFRQAHAGDLVSHETWTQLAASDMLLPLEQRAKEATSTAVTHALNPLLLWSWRVRFTTGSLVFAVQLLAFGTVGTLAARDIRIHV